MSQSFKEGLPIASRFVLNRCLGTGAFGEVWLATDMRTMSAPIALKLLREFAQEDERIRARLRREAKILADVDHPNIAKLFDYDLDAETPFIAMEYIDGRTLLEEIHSVAASGRHFEPEEELRLIDELCAAVSWAHDSNVLHRDLKPTNLMVLRRAGRIFVKVLDFGIAKLTAESASAATTLGRRLGTLSYMSPEQARGDPVDVRSDVFALGVVFFELLTFHRAWFEDEKGKRVHVLERGKGSLPLNDPVAIAKKLMTAPRPRPSDHRPRAAGAIDGVLMRAMAADPDDRFGGVFELRSALIEALERSYGDDEAPDSVLVPAQVVEHDPRSSPMIAPVVVQPKTLTRARALAIAGAVGIAIGTLVASTMPELSGLEQRTEPPKKRATPPPPVPAIIEVEPPKVEDETIRVDASPHEPVRSAAPRAHRMKALVAKDPSRGERPVERDLEASLEAAKNNPSDAQAIARLRRAIERAESDVADERLRESIHRRAMTAAVMNDLQALERCVADLRGALRR